MRKHIAFIWTVLVALSLSGCATVPGQANPDAQSVADEIHDVLDEATRVTVEKTDVQGRLLRAYYLIAVFTVYGNASIERYSHSKSGDAGGLLGRVMAAEAALQTAWTNADKSYYPVDRARLTFAIADLAAKAVRPTVTMGVGLIGTTPAAGAEAALGIFKNAVKTVVYGEAYREGFQRSVLQLNGPGYKPQHPPQVELLPGNAGDTAKGAWKELADLLDSTCEELKRKANLNNAAFKCGDLSELPAVTAKQQSGQSQQPIEKK